MNIKDIKSIKELVELMAASDLSEIALEDQDVKLTLKRDRNEAQVITQTVVPAVAPAALAAPVAAAPAAAAAPAPVENTNLHYVTAPLVGTFYASPSPDAPAFAKVGDRVKKGQVICIIEAMKLMNEIESDADGVIVEILVENASPVDYGAKIYAIEPA